MIRRADRIAFAAVGVAAVAISACGRQVTPNPPGLGPGGAPPGFMAVHFDVQAPFNFQQYQYMLVFNTSGSRVTPSTDTVQTNWAGYSFAMVALGTGGNAYAEPIQFIPSTKNPHSPPAWLQLKTTPQQFSFNLNSNGTGTEFSLLAQDNIFKGIASPSPSPSASPSNLWTFNAFTTQATNGGSWTFLDSLGYGGPIDPQFVSPELCMTEEFDNTYYARYDSVPDPAAQIVSVEISNNPVSPKPCP